MPETQEQLHLKLSGGAKLKYFIIRTLYTLTCSLAAILPERAVYRLCVGLAMTGYRRLPKFRRLALEQLETAFGGEKSPEDIEEILKQSYINQGKNLAEFLMIPHKSREWVARKVRLNDPHGLLKSELEKGRGIIAAGAHVGNIEMVCAWIGINKLPMVTVVKAQRDQFVTDLIMKSRSKWGTEMVFRARGVKKECQDQLEKNKIVGLVADQNVASGGVFVDFFGKRAATATGPADLAMRTGLPVIPSFLSTRGPDDTLTIHVLDPIYMRDSGDKERDLHYNVQQYTTAIENFIRKYPTEYLWWHRRWKTRPEGEA